MLGMSLVGLVRLLSQIDACFPSCVFFTCNFMVEINDHDDDNDKSTL